MHPLAYISDNWQKWLPPLAVLGTIFWFVMFRHAPASEASIFAALLVIYMVHQTEEHLWPGGFRQFANARIFKSGRDDWPVDEGGVALINIGYVWVPLVLASMFPGPLRWIGLGWVGLTLVNAITHIVGTARFGIYNPGLITAIALFLPFTIWVLAYEHAKGMLSAGQIALIILLGIALHIPVAALFVIPWRRAREARAA